MRNARLVSRTRLVLAALGLGLTESGGRDARADRIVLRGGGQIRGKGVADPKQPDRVTVLTEKGRTPLRFQKPQVVRVDCEPSALDGYLVKCDQAAATAEAQHGLALWCEQNRLTDLAAIHEAAQKHDPQFAPAHQRLGHALYGGPGLSVDFNLNQAVPLRGWLGSVFGPRRSRSGVRLRTPATRIARSMSHPSENRSNLNQAVPLRTGGGAP